MAVAIDAAPAAIHSPCEVSRRPEFYLNKRIVIDALLTDASPHGVYLADRKNPKNWRCIIEAGQPISGDIWDVFAKSPKAGRQLPQDASVRVSGVFKLEIRDRDGGGKYRAYFLDEMRFTYLTGRARSLTSPRRTPSSRAASTGRPHAPATPQH